MKKISDLHVKWMKNPSYRKEYMALDEEFTLASTLIAARAKAGLTQQQLAEKMQTTQSSIARLESGKSFPSGRTLQKLAAATGSKLKIEFESLAKSTKGRAA